MVKGILEIVVNKEQKLIGLKKGEFSISITTDQAKQIVIGLRKAIFEIIDMEMDMPKEKKQ